MQNRFEKLNLKWQILIAKVKTFQEIVACLSDLRLIALDRQEIQTIENNFALFHLIYVAVNQLNPSVNNTDQVYLACKAHLREAKLVAKQMEEAYEILIKASPQWIVNSVPELDFKEEKADLRKIENSSARIQQKLLRAYQNRLFEVRVIEKIETAANEALYVLGEMKEQERKLPQLKEIRTSLEQIETTADEIDAKLVANPIVTSSIRKDVIRLCCDIATLEAKFKAKEVKQEMKSIAPLLERAQAAYDRGQSAQNDEAVRYAQEAHLKKHLQAIKSKVNWLKAMTISVQDFRMVLGHVKDEFVLPILNKLVAVINSAHTPIPAFKEIFARSVQIADEPHKMILPDLKAKADEIMAKPDEQKNYVLVICKALQDFCRDVQLEADRAGAAFQKAIDALMPNASQTVHQRLSLR